MGTPQNNGNGVRIVVAFVDVLFAIVMGISATNVLQQEWFKQEPGFVWKSSFALEMAVLLLGHATLILSWVGYHQSVGTDPQNIRTAPQWASFIIDILLLACYLLILVKFNNFWLVLLTLVLVFVLYVAWDLFRQRQRASANKETPQEMGVSRFWAIYFALLFIVFWWLDSKDITLLMVDLIPGLGSDAISIAGSWVFLVLAFAGVLLYRRHKKRLWLKPVLDMQIGHWPLR